MNDIKLAQTQYGWRASIKVFDKCYARYFRFERDAREFQKEVAITMVMYGDAWAPECNRMYSECNPVYKADPSMYEPLPLQIPNEGGNAMRDRFKIVERAHYSSDEGYRQAVDAYVAANYMVVVSSYGNEDYTINNNEDYAILIDRHKPNEKLYECPKCHEGFSEFEFEAHFEKCGLEIWHKANGLAEDIMFCIEDVLNESSSPEEAQEEVIEKAKAVLELFNEAFNNNCPACASWEKNQYSSIYKGR